LRGTPGPTSHERAPERGSLQLTPWPPARAEWWLRHVGREATPEAVDQVAPHVRTTGKPDVVEVQAFARLVRLGQTPTLMRLQARSKRRRLTRTGCSGSGKSGVRLCPSWPRATSAMLSWRSCRAAGASRGRDPPGGRWRLASDGPSPARAPWCRDSCKRVGLRWATRPRRCGPVRRCVTLVARSDQPEVLPAPPVLLATPVVLRNERTTRRPIAAGSVLSSLQLSQAGSGGGSGAGERGEAAAWSARSASSRCWLVAGGGRGSC